MSRRPRGKKPHPSEPRSQGGPREGDSGTPGRRSVKRSAKPSGANRGARSEGQAGRRSAAQRRNFKRRPPSGDREAQRSTGPSRRPASDEAAGERKVQRLKPEPRAAKAEHKEERPAPGTQYGAPFEGRNLDVFESNRQDEGQTEDDSELGIGSRVIPPAMNLAFSDEDEEDDDEESGASAFHVSGSSAEREFIAGEHPDMQTTIQELEARLDGMIRQASEFSSDPYNEIPVVDDTALAPGHETTQAVAERDSEQEDGGAQSDESAIEATKELLSSEYYRRQWGRLGLRRRAEHIDDFGHDPAVERKLLPVLDNLFLRYFRCETQGIERIPADGRCLVVANHSGTLPLDGLMLRAALRLRHPKQRPLRWLAEDFIFYLPFVGVLMNRLGAVRACQENAQRLLASESLVAAFPEGTKGVKKLFSQRYQLQRFGRGGYIRLCLKTRTPLVPCAIIGAEETNPVLLRLEQLPRLLGWPYLPVTPTFPLFGPLGLLPAPTKWKMIFGEPMEFDQYGPADANDHVLVGRLSDQVQDAIREMLRRGLRERKGVWLG